MNVSITSSYSPVGISVPIQNGSNGYFQQTFDTKSQVKQNLINFLKTKKGERRMLPNFGSRLHTILFYENDGNSTEIAKNIISEEISTWMPEISIIDIKIKAGEITSENDNYTMRISINFMIRQTKQTDSVSFNLTNSSI
jgi:phage baseplate assembly protein W